MKPFNETGSFFYNLEKIVRRSPKRIILPEGNDPRIVGAASRLKIQNLLDPILIGNQDEIHNVSKEIDADISKVTIVDPNEYNDMDYLVEKFVERRNGKIDEESARKLLLEDPNYFGTILVYTRWADGLVSGAAHTTGETVRPALQIIKVKPEFKKVSGAYLMIKDQNMFIFADCAININPTSEDLAEIAKQSEITARKYGLDPKIAMLSFSTHGSAKDELVDKVTEGYRIAKEKYPELVIDGELQLDAAIVKSVAEKKVKDSPVAGQANILIFPDIQAGNIGYKIAQRFGRFEAIGPILQGLNSPVNDLSRGCNEEDVYKLCIISALEAISLEK